MNSKRPSSPRSHLEETMKISEPLLERLDRTNELLEEILNELRKAPSPLGGVLDPYPKPNHHNPKPIYQH